jgi:hypothetical protein
MGHVPGNFKDLPVDEFVEQFQFVQPSDNWESILKYLDREDGVLVGHRDRLDGILTPMDVLSYLHRIASPFVMLAEIELSLRRIIIACVSDDELRTCILNSLPSKYSQGDLPASLSEMTFNDYVQIIGDRSNWSHFTKVFGSGDWQRKTTTQRLRQVGELRNEVFHFRREIVSQDLETLSARRDWLQMKARAFEGVKAEKEAPAEKKETKAPTTKPTRRRWDEPSFFEALEEARNAEESAAARKLFEWASRRGLFFRWGTGTKTGSCIAAFGDKYGPSVLTMWTSGTVKIPLVAITRLPPFTSEERRRKLRTSLNVVDGIYLAAAEVTTDRGVLLSEFVNEANLERFIDTMDWVMNEIEGASAGGPDEPTREDYRRVLTHIPVPRGQQQLYKALYDAGDEGLTHDELVVVMGRRDRRDLSGVLGALGRRISGIPGYGEARRPGVEMVIAYEPLADGQHRLRLVPGMRAALEELEPAWLREMTL